MHASKICQFETDGPVHAVKKRSLHVAINHLQHLHTANNIPLCFPKKDYPNLTSIVN